MPSDEFETVLNAIRANVRDALGDVGPKPFAIKNGMGETVVRDLVKAHNKDVQLGTLAKIAKGAGVPLVELLQVGPPQDLPSAEQLAAMIDLGLDAGVNETTPRERIAEIVAPVVREQLRLFRSDDSAARKAARNVRGKAARSQPATKRDGKEAPRKT